MAETRLLLVRHGQTDWNRDRRFQGHADPPLNDTGRLQARTLADELAAEPIAAVYSSDLRRAADTARIIARSKGLPVRQLAALREVDVGEFSGLTLAEIDARWPDAQGRYETRGYGWVTGESYETMASRVLTALRTIAADHPGKAVVVVGHGGTIRAMLAVADGLDVASHRRVVGPAANCAVFRLAVRDGDLLRVD
jgi:2,3-bisphosphoglycerate-dependent phosphoglycerate mutase